MTHDEEEIFKMVLLDIYDDLLEPTLELATRIVFELYRGAHEGRHLWNVGF